MDTAATEVGETYLSDRSSRSPAVTTAYERLQRETDQLFELMTHETGTGRVRIAFTRAGQPYDCDQELIAAVRSTGVLEVTTAAGTIVPLHPLLDCGFGGPFDRFRAVHDLVGHAATGLGFELADEIAAWQLQSRMHGPLARRALATELLAVNCAVAITGETPEHRAMLLTPDLVRRARAESSMPNSTAGGAST